jgi:tellurium resistance protein TerD
MSINLQKGSRVDLTKGNLTTTKYNFGLGWDTNATDSGEAYDLDVSAFILGANGKRLSDEHFVFYNNLQSPNNSVVHSGDNLTGDGDGDDETLTVDFQTIEPEAETIVFVVTIHDVATRKQTFGQLRNAYIRAYNQDNPSEEFLKYDLDEDFSIETAVEFARLYKKDGEWKFNAVGTGMRGGLEDYVNQF